LKTRVLSGIGIGILYLAVFVLGNTAVQLCAVFLFAMVSQYEMMAAIRAKGHEAMAWPGYLCAALLVPAAWYVGAAALFSMYVLVISAAFAVRILSKNVTTPSLFWSLFSMAYPMPLYGVMALTLSVDAPYGKAMLLFALAVVCLTDMLAYFIGMAFGKHKLCPNLSPKKSVEGAAGGLLGGVIAGAVIFYLQPLLKIDYPLWVFLALSPVCSVLGQIGDLAASAIKREMGIKDFGNIFPGHGGMLDRFDSLLFALPAVYFAYVLAVSFRPF
jgi:phosphatidate cytidylyltransferase